MECVYCAVRTESVFTVVNIRTTRFNVHQFYVLHTQCIYVFRVDLRTNSDYFPIQHQLTGFCNRDGVFTARYGLYLYLYCKGRMFIRNVGAHLNGRGLISRGTQMPVLQSVHTATRAHRLCVHWFL